MLLSYRFKKPAQVQVQVFGLPAFHMRVVNSQILYCPQRTELHFSGRAGYKLTGIITYTSSDAESGHYLAFIRSIKDQKQWFCTNDAQVPVKQIVIIKLDTKQFNFFFFQVIPVSTCTVLQQDPFMLFYERA